jgi:hypothetical protein
LGSARRGTVDKMDALMRKSKAEFKNCRATKKRYNFALSVI